MFIIAPIVATEPTLSQRLTEVRQRIAEACTRAGRKTDEVLLLAVSKTATESQLREGLALGLRDLGENRVQKLQERLRQLPGILSPDVDAASLHWHMIGHLQRNKVREVVPHVSLIHSVDSLRLAEEIDTFATQTQRRVSVLLQVNASEEPQKFGCSMEDASALAEAMVGKPGLELRGLMTMAELSEDADRVRRAFVRTRELFETLQKQLGSSAFSQISMGMSHDYEMAIAEGATIVRVGSAIFGPATLTPPAANPLPNPPPQGREMEPH